MKRAARRVAATVIALGAGACLSWTAAGTQPAPTFTSYTRQFEEAYDATSSLPPAARVKAVGATLAALDPAYYSAKRHDPGDYDAMVARSLDRFASIRLRYDQVQRDFPATFATGIKQFRRTFPAFQLNMPVYLLHSLGEMDGGTRSFDGRPRLIFGADVIARIHDADTMLPLFDHELFHVENEQHFKDCEQFWCALWEEGLAVYATSVMNPGADDRRLLLASPQPIRAQVDAHWREALCDMIPKLMLDAGEKDYRQYFTGHETTPLLPPRSGYYIGYRTMMVLGRTHSLVSLARLPRDAALPLLRSALASMASAAGGCPAKPV